MRITRLLAAGLSVSMLFLANPGNATVIYDNGNPSTVNGYSILGSNETKDDFTLASSVAITSVGFYFQNYNGITGWDQAVSYNIYGSDATTLLASGAGQNVTPTLSSFPWCCGGGNAWLVQFDLASPFAAAAGTQYWLGLTGAGGPAAWWVTTGTDGSGNGTTQFGSTNIDFAYYLEGGATSVPEPGTLALFGLGLAGLAFARRKRTI